MTDTRAIDRSFRLPPETIRRLEWLAARHHDGNRSSAIRRAVDVYYRQEAGDDAPANDAAQ